MPTIWKVCETTAFEFDSNEARFTDMADGIIATYGNISCLSILLMCKTT